MSRLCPACSLRRVNSNKDVCFECHRQGHVPARDMKISAPVVPIIEPDEESIKRTQHLDKASLTNTSLEALTLTRECYRRIRQAYTQTETFRPDLDKALHQANRSLVALVKEIDKFNQRLASESDDLSFDEQIQATLDWYRKELPPEWRLEFIDRFHAQLTEEEEAHLGNHR